MADWLNIAGGAGKGYVQGQEDLQRKAEFDAMQRQRLRVEKQQQMDDELAATLRKVRPAGKYTDTDSSPEAGAEGPPSPTAQASRPTTTTTVTAADADRQRADIMARGGRLQDLQAAATLRQNAYQAEQQAEQQRQREGFNVLRQAKMLRTRGDPASLEAATRLLQQGYSQYPDGHEITVESRNGVPHVGVAGPDGRYVQQPVPITGESVDALINQGVSMLSPEMMTKQQELGIQGRTAAAHEMTAEAAKKNAESAAQEAYDKTMGRGASRADALAASTNAYHYAMANWQNARASIDRTAGKQTAAEKAQDLIDTYVPIIKAANPGMSDEQARMQAAQVALRDPNAKTSPDVGLSEQGLFRLKDQPGKLFRRDKKGEPEEVMLPGDIKSLAGSISKNLPPKDGAKAAPAKVAPAPAAPQRSTMERVTDEGAKSKARSAVTTAQDQLRTQFARGEVSPTEFAKGWATLGAQMQALQ